jgi:hypothetical protein
MLYACNNSQETADSSSSESQPISQVKKDLPSLLSRVTQLEDSITKEVTKNPDKRIGSFVFLDLINRLKDVISNYPTAPESASCLFKLHMKYGEMKGYKESIAYGDTLLQRFPDFKDRDLVLQSIATTYDIWIKPRDANKVGAYLSKLLESRTLSESEKNEIKNRLKYIHLDVFAYSLKINKSKTTSR